MRPLLQKLTSVDLDYNYFSQGLVTQYELQFGAVEGLYRDPRGFLLEPHTGRKVPLGTREVESYHLPEWLFSRVLFVEKKLK